MKVFRIHGIIRQGSVMSPQLFSLFMNKVVRKMKASVGNVEMEMGI